MKRYSRAIATLLLLLLAAVTVTAKEYDYINISDPHLKKTPIAITRFKAFNRMTTEVQEGERAERTLKDALSFTGYLKVMNSNAFLSDPSQAGIALGEIDFKDWTSIGADLMITGGIKAEGGLFMLELRLFDTLSTKLLLGRRYHSVGKEKIRTTIHRFCSELAYKLTGNYGVFGSQIAFVSTASGRKEIYISDFDGNNPRRVTQHNSICLSPAWSHDGQWLAYVSYAKGKPDIFIKHLTENRGAIVNYDGMNIAPDWMPDQLKLAATLSFSGSQEIYLLTKKGEIIKRVTKSWGVNVSPRFSPDGNRIAFTSSRGGNPQIYVQDLESGEVRRVTFQGRYNTSPAWSPDGKKIAYVGIDKNKINKALK